MKTKTMTAEKVYRIIDQVGMFGGKIAETKTGFMMEYRGRIYTGWSQDNRTAETCIRKAAKKAGLKVSILKSGHERKGDRYRDFVHFTFVR